MSRVESLVFLKGETCKIVTSLTEMATYPSLTDGQSCYVIGDGLYKYTLSTNTWIKTAGFNDYDFKTEQPIQYYYDLLGNWDDAIFQAQVNVYLRGFSTKLVLPSGVVNVTRPILFNDALYYRIDKMYPSIGVYDKVNKKFGNSRDDNYFTTSWALTGQGKSSQPSEGKNPASSIGGGSIGGLTCINFIGGQSADSGTSTDTTWMNYGVIHAAPDFIDGRLPSDYYGKTSPCLSGFNAIEISNLNIEGNLRSIHGIVIFGGHFHMLDNITIHDCYGAGIYLNWVFDMNINHVTYIHCGRMSPNYKDYINAGKFNVKYQTYAPLQITCSGVQYDNSNYIRVDRNHFENNFRVPADVIVGGNSTPIWINNAHHESGPPIITTGDSKRVCYCPSIYGVAYLGQDSESGFDYTNITYNQSGGKIIARDCYGYVTNYTHVAYIPLYGQLDIAGFDFGGDIEMSGNNGFAFLTASNCKFKNLTVNGGFNQGDVLTLYDVDVDSITLNYMTSFKLRDVKVNGPFTFNNVDLTYQYPDKVLDNVTVQTIDGDMRGGTVTNLKILSTDKASSFINSGGSEVEVSNLAYLMGYLKS